MNVNTYLYVDRCPPPLAKLIPSVDSNSSSLLELHIPQPHLAPYALEPDADDGGFLALRKSHVESAKKKGSNMPSRFLSSSQLPPPFLAMLIPTVLLNRS